MGAQLALPQEAATEDVIVLGSQVPDKTILPVAGGKGGTGKSTLTANLGLGLALLGYKVIVIDLDLGGADLHLFFDQIAPARGLSSFFNREAASLRDVVLQTPNRNLQLICGGNELVGLANLPFTTKEKLVRHVRALEADYVLVDLGAGTAFNTLDLFALSEHGLIVCTPEPHARVDAYGFVKNVVYRRLRRQFARQAAILEAIDTFAQDAGRRSGRIAQLVDRIQALDPTAAAEAALLLRRFRPRLVLNRVRSKRHLEEATRFVNLVEEYLSVSMEYVGYVRLDNKLVEACERRRPVLLDSPKAQASRDISCLLMNGLGVADRLQRFAGDDYRKMADLARAEARVW